MKERTCLICGKTFVKVIGVSFAKYCSEKCRAIASRKRYTPVKKTLKICPTCRAEFLASNKNQIYCCDKCTPSYKRRQATKYLTHKYICEWCGKLFYGGVTRNKHSHRFCSRECSAKHIAQIKNDRKKPLKYVGKVEGWHTNICVICGQVFLDKAERSCCSVECRKEYNRQQARQRAEQKREAVYKAQRKHCRNCGCGFTPTVKKSKVFCSEDCRDEYQKRLQHICAKKRLRGKVVDKDISLEKLIVRDNGRCKLCGRVVDVNDYTIRDGAFIAGAMYPSIDHIKPLSKGGVHSWDNVQLAHCRCNTLKGARDA